MIKAADLENEYFLVLIPGKELVETASQVQKIVSEHYNLYPDQIYPQLHITIDRIEKNRSERAEEILKEKAKEFGKIEIEVDRFTCIKFSDQHQLVLEVNETESLREFSEAVHQSLAAEGISTIENYGEWMFHITIISNIFAENPIPVDELTEICLFMEGMSRPLSAAAEKMEIWRPTLDPGEKVIASFSLN
ncbi:2'-5' RNA ligase superfamily protein [Halanaerobium saccharolyticum]|uniref:2'-5' RNA ligase superfamily protein n=1 Tax=Halanaerobium saccharolyticum TaxID=43595 RepID=A0A4R7YML5_9FIRM|nr:2'-5' RNA ligase family protein [Halanaerobium saccharolyticum]RAK05129.1 2'-5' RNA ligase superfamily protein [Halanaerobium saccharolyticum]TDV98896.1 2'-5' RNA ligase superfamily protein [Halanaerobium saccharolyticum]TDX51598.1 2'-5' RNA ligase superfamily protein [Halanaerobium saccharolyticum]